MKMNDTGEFEYAKGVIYNALDEASRHYNFPKVAQSLIAYTRSNLEKLLSDSAKLSRAYCACLSYSADHPAQWEIYAENRTGFAIGFKLQECMNLQISAVTSGKPYFFCAPVIYSERDQHDLVWRLVQAGIRDLKRFVNICSQQSFALTAIRNRVTLEIVVQLLTLIDFIKAPAYSSEREMRLIIDQNDGSLKASNIQYYKRDSESIPFIFIDLCTTNTKFLPLAEIMIGPNAQFLKEKCLLEKLFDEIHYDSRPKITQSLLAT
jgi:hypothetical protein